MATCQICGRVIKDKSGVIAHHGYQRPGGGWQTESCMGARYQAYELSSDRIPTVIAIVTDYVKSQQAQLEKLVSEPPATIKIEVRSRSVYQKEYITVEKPANFDPTNIWGAMRPRSYESAYSDWRRQLEHSIKMANIDLHYLTDRLAQWVAPTVAQAI